MPVFVRTTDGRNYRVRGDKLKLWWRLARRFGGFIHLREEPDGNDLWVWARGIVHFAYVSQATLDAAVKAQAEADKKNPNPGGPPRAQIPGGRRH